MSKKEEAPEQIQEPEMMKSELNFIADFLKQSVQMHVRNKSNEHQQKFSKEETQKFSNEDINGMLTDLSKDSKYSNIPNIQELSASIQANIDNYITQMDKELVMLMDITLPPTKNPDAVEQDEVLKIVSDKCSFVKAAQKLEELTAKPYNTEPTKDIQAIVQSSIQTQENISSNIKSEKDTRWKDIANILTKVLPKVAAFCEKKNAQAKLKTLAKKVQLNPEYINNITRDKTEASAQRSNTINQNKSTIRI